MTTGRCGKRYTDANAKANEYLYRRVDIEDVVSAHLLAAEHAASIGFRKYIISATTPFCRRMSRGCATMRHVWSTSAFQVTGLNMRGREWKMLPSIDRVYVNERARNELGWRPKYDFRSILDRLKAGDDMRSPLARLVGSKGYHAQAFCDGPYPVGVTVHRRRLRT